MPTVEEIQPQALALCERDRAELASILLVSLPPFLDDEDEGVTEALRREMEMDADPSSRMTLEEFKSGVAVSRRQ